MKKLVAGLALALVLMVAPSAGAFLDHNDHSTNADAKAKAKAQAGAVAGAAAIGLQGQNAEGGDTHTDVDASENRNAYRGSFSASIPEGNEGPALLTPWGGVGISNMSRVTELLMFAEVVEDGSEEHKWLIAELQSEIGGTCRWLGFGPKGWKFPFLLGLDCWPDLRFDPKFGR
jgi:hypothetical protein